MYQTTINCTTASQRICNRSAVLCCSDRQFLGHSSALRESPIHQHHREREREREVFIEKWGFTVPFLAKESLKDPASLSQISAQRSARGFELDQLSGDVEPRLQRA